MLQAMIGAMVIGLVGVFALAVLCTIPLYFLWNWLCPIIFGLPIITFWQALGLSFLSGFLFNRSTTAKS